MSRKIIHYPNEILARKAAPITEITDEIKELAKEMSEIMYDNEGIGLAAPQVGESIRLITVDLSGPEKREDLQVFVNPEIVAREGEIETEEGCLSVIGYRAKVKRAAKIKFKALDLEGKEVEFDAEDLYAVCLQHELDHLDGILFIDHISRLKRNLYEKRLKKWLRKRKNV
ncbi:peptide deformylase [Desulfohalobiaceae bacterium Ax17]|jgi:peptide deformylase|uniref:peptide deformylase n=1 Tax=Desulfovulcanus ferrireducens TaxID=2831190 RepID=UPI00207BC2FF|nr:peptide deformylase [Desulfovulcanus ferrireducens]MBT8764384.1 peptide deformylase [Desulfovulcanus ferrireducens]